MNFNTYQEKVVSLCIYPKASRIFYPALGLAGEAGECCDKIKKIYRDDSGELTDERKEALQGELGDTLFYLAALAHDLGLNFNDIACLNLSKLFSRQQRGVLTGDGDNR